MQSPESRPESIETSITHPFSRRHLLKGLGALGVGILVSRFSAAEAAEVDGSASVNAFLVEYAKYLSKQRLKHVTVAQVIDAHLKSRGPIKNTPPPRSLWPNIVGTLHVVDRMIEELNSPLVEIISAYRSVAYNARCPGACRDSQHTHNHALDLRFAVSPRRVADVAASLRSRGLFSGGIGRYGSFTHVDTRGVNVDWHGR